MGGTVPIRGIPPALAAACLALFMSCSKAPPPPVFDVDETRVLVLTPVPAAPNGVRWVRLLNTILPGATYQPLEAWSGDYPDATLLVFPAAEYIPVEKMALIPQAMSHGTPMLFLGREPFQRHVRKEASGAYSTREMRDRTGAHDARAVDGFSSVQLWRHEYGGEMARRSVRVARHASLPWPGVEVEASTLEQYHVMQAVDVALSFDEGQPVDFFFYARGQGDATRLVVRVRDASAVDWVQVVPLTPQWRLVRLAAPDWRKRDGGGQGGFDWGGIIAFQAGLDPATAPQGEGAHLFGVSDVRMTRALDEEAAPRLPFIARTHRRYATTAYSLQSVATEWAARARNIQTDAIQPGGAMACAEGVGPGRWISLWHARDRSGAVRGDVASLYTRLHADAAEVWGWVGLEPARSVRDVWPPLLRETIERLQQGRYLNEARMDRYVLSPGEFYTLETGSIGPAADELPTRYTLEMLDSDQQIFRRVSSPAVTDTTVRRAPLPLNAGVVPGLAGDLTRQRVRVSLEEISGSQRLFDRVIFPLWVQGPATPASADDWLRVSGARISLGRVPVFLLGTHYHPGLRESVWLDGRYFAPALIERDMNVLRDAGINAISITCSDLHEVRQVRVVAELARARGLWIILRLPHALERGWADPAWLEKLVHELRLNSDPLIFALDLAPADASWLPNPEQAWMAWLDEQGIPEEDALRTLESVQASEDLDGQVRYRRFADDQFSRRLGALIRALRHLECRALITSRVGFADDTLPLPRHVFSGAHHLDFFALNLDDHLMGETALREVSFWAALARAAGEGRPVIWTGIGAPLGDAPDERDFGYQARKIRSAYEMVFHTQSAGGFLRQYAPGSAHPFHADEGVIHADRTWRPAMKEVRNIANRLREYRLSPAPWSGREIHYPVGRGGWRALWETWRGVYQDERKDGSMVEVRLAGLNQPSVSAPHDRMNAEWARIEIDRQARIRAPGETVELQPQQRVRLELLNTGVAAWSASVPRTPRTVWIEVRHSGGRPPQYLEAPYTAAGRRAWLDWTPPEQGRYTLQAHGLGVGSFGERIAINVAP